MAAAVCAGVLTLSSCASRKPAPVDTSSMRDMEFKDPSRVGGGIASTYTTTNATVISIADSGKSMELKMPDGGIRSYAVDPDVISLEHVKVGDEVRVVVAEEHAVFAGKATGAARGGTATTAIKMPQTSSSVYRSVSNTNYTAKVTAIDAWNDQLTLQLPDGRTKTVKVNPDVNLADVNVGDDVSIDFSEATVITLEKP
jgi:hypothetical protein